MSDRWQMVPVEGGYVLEWVDSGKPVTTTPLPEREALRVGAEYNTAAWRGDQAPSPSTDTSTALLDVERLARAIHAIHLGCMRPVDLCPFPSTFHDEWAAALAHEYATLSVTPQDTE